MYIYTNMCVCVYTFVYVCTHFCIYIYIYIMCVCVYTYILYIYTLGLAVKSSLHNVISAVDNFFYKCDPNTATPIKEVC